MNQKILAEQFQELHSEFFILPNIWNAGGAKIFESKGFKAVATTSAGVAFSLGYADGEVITIDELITVVKQITKRINIPLSVDMERGYGNTIEEVVDNVKRVIEAGAVGINIEDGRIDETLDELDFQLEKIKAIVNLKDELNIPFVINARTCVYWLSLDGDKMKIAKERTNAFVEAGADCVFIPGGLKKDEMKELTKNINAPLNMVLTPVFNNFNEMKEIGIKRLTIGSAASQTVVANLIKIADELNNDKVDTMMNRSLNYKTANDLFI